MAESDRTEFLKKQRDDKKIYRAKLKLDKTVVEKPVRKIVEVEKNALSKIFGSLKSSKGEPLSKITVANYSTKINRLAQMLTGADYENSKFLHDYAKVIKHMNECDLKSKKDYISPVVRLLRHEGGNEKAIDKYLEFMSELKSTEEQSRGQNVLTKKSDMDNSMSLQEVMDRYNSYSIYDGDKINLNKLLYKLIVCFYFKSDLVPRNDLGVMRLAKWNKKDFNKDNNYITIKNGEPYRIVMLAYKTFSTYGKQTFTITDELSKMLKLYINEFAKVNGDLLFTKSGEQIADKTFLELIKKAMTEVVGKPLNIDLIRSIIITDFYSKVRSINEKEEFARKFLHGKNVAEEYVKVNL